LLLIVLGVALWVPSSAQAQNDEAAMKATLHYKEYAEEDIAMVQMRLANGALAHFCASFAADDHAADPWTVMVKVIGTAGSTRYSYRDHVEIKPGAAQADDFVSRRGERVHELSPQLTSSAHDENALAHLIPPRCWSRADRRTDDGSSRGTRRS
jgi:predicted dehydrogenase